MYSYVLMRIRIKRKLDNQSCLSSWSWNVPGFITRFQTNIYFPCALTNDDDDDHNNNNNNNDNDNDNNNNNNNNNNLLHKYVATYFKAKFRITCIYMQKKSI